MSQLIRDVKEEFGLSSSVAPDEKGTVTGSSFPLVGGVAKTSHGHHTTSGAPGAYDSTGTYGAPGAGAGTGTYGHDTHGGHKTPAALGALGVGAGAGALGAHEAHNRNAGTGAPGAYDSTGAYGAPGAYDSTTTSGAPGAYGSAGAFGAPGARDSTGTYGAPGVSGAYDSTGTYGAPGAGAGTGAYGAQDALGGHDSHKAPAALGALGVGAGAGALGAHEAHRHRDNSSGAPGAYDNSTGTYGTPGAYDSSAGATGAHGARDIGVGGAYGGDHGVHDDDDGDDDLASPTGGRTKKKGGLLGKIKGKALKVKEAVLSHSSNKGDEPSPKGTGGSGQQFGHPTAPHHFRKDEPKLDSHVDPALPSGALPAGLATRDAGHTMPVLSEYNPSAAAPAGLATRGFDAEHDNSTAESRGESRTLNKGDLDNNHGRLDRLAEGIKAKLPGKHHQHDNDNREGSDLHAGGIAGHQPELRREEDLGDVRRDRGVGVPIIDARGLEGDNAKGGSRALQGSEFSDTSGAFDSGLQDKRRSEATALPGIPTSESGRYRDSAAVPAATPIPADQRPIDHLEGHSNLKDWAHSKLPRDHDDETKAALEGAGKDQPSGSRDLSALGVGAGVGAAAAAAGSEGLSGKPLTERDYQQASTKTMPLDQSAATWDKGLFGADRAALEGEQKQAQLNQANRVTPEQSAVTWDKGSFGTDRAALESDQKQARLDQANREYLQAQDDLQKGRSLDFSGLPADSASSLSQASIDNHRSGAGDFDQYLSSNTTPTSGLGAGAAGAVLGAGGLSGGKAYSQPRGDILQKDSALSTPSAYDQGQSGIDHRAGEFDHHAPSAATFDGIGYSHSEPAANREASGYGKSSLGYDEPSQGTDSSFARAAEYAGVGAAGAGLAGAAGRSNSGDQRQRPSADKDVLGVVGGDQLRGEAPRNDTRTYTQMAADTYNSIKDTAADKLGLSGSAGQQQDRLPLYQGEFDDRGSTTTSKPLTERLSDTASAGSQYAADTYRAARDVAADKLGYNASNDTQQQELGQDIPTNSRDMESRDLKQPLEKLTESKPLTERLADTASAGSQYAADTYNSARDVAADKLGYNNASGTAQPLQQGQEVPNTYSRGLETREVPQTQQAETKPLTQRVADTASAATQYATESLAAGAGAVAAGAGHLKDRTLGSSEGTENQKPLTEKAKETVAAGAQYVAESLALGAGAVAGGLSHANQNTLSSEDGKPFTERTREAAVGGAQYARDSAAAGAGVVASGLGSLTTQAQQQLQAPALPQGAAGYSGISERPGDWRAVHSSPPSVEQARVLGDSLTPATGGYSGTPASHQSIEEQRVSAGTSGKPITERLYDTASQAAAGITSSLGLGAGTTTTANTDSSATRDVPAPVGDASYGQRNFDQEGLVDSSKTTVSPLESGTSAASRWGADNSGHFSSGPHGGPDYSVAAGTRGLDSGIGDGTYSEAAQPDASVLGMEEKPKTLRERYEENSDAGQKYATRGLGVIPAHDNAAVPDSGVGSVGAGIGGVGANELSFSEMRTGVPGYAGAGEQESDKVKLAKAAMSPSTPDPVTERTFGNSVGEEAPKSPRSLFQRLQDTASSAAAMVGLAPTSPRSGTTSAPNAAGLDIDHTNTLDSNAYASSPPKKDNVFV
eukprot:jgi/Mesen1/8340/ME000461S07751